MSNGLQLAPKLVFFGHFFKFGPLVLLEISYDDSLEHCPTTSRGKTHGQIFGGPKLGPKLGFSHILKVATWDKV